MKFDVIFSLEFHSKLRSDESRKNKHRRCVCKHQGRICFTTSEGSLRLPSGLSQCIVKIYITLCFLTLGAFEFCERPEFDV